MQRTWYYKFIYGRDRRIQEIDVYSIKVSIVFIEKCIVKNGRLSGAAARTGNL